MKARDLPLYPFTDVPDEREAGVVLLECDEETKVTADRVRDSWRIVDWEVMDYDGNPSWFARSWFCVSRAHVERIASMGGA